MNDFEQMLELEEKAHFTKTFPKLTTEQGMYIDSLKDEVMFLSKHLYEVQKNLAKWMLSQKSFKELAIQFGTEKGLSVDEIIEKSLSIKLDVLESKNSPKHGTNAKDSQFLIQNSEELMQEILEEQE
jgi:hypothetical protein